jgi:hypothetical protein
MNPARATCPSMWRGCEKPLGTRLPWRTSPCNFAGGKSSVPLSFREHARVGPASRRRIPADVLYGGRPRGHAARSERILYLRPDPAGGYHCRRLYADSDSRVSTAAFVTVETFRSYRGQLLHCCLRSTCHGPTRRSSRKARASLQTRAGNASGQSHGERLWDGPEPAETAAS